MLSQKITAAKAPDTAKPTASAQASDHFCFCRNARLPIPGSR